MGLKRPNPRWSVGLGEPTAGPSYPLPQSVEMIFHLQPLGHSDQAKGAESSEANALERLGRWRLSLSVHHLNLCCENTCFLICTLLSPLGSSIWYLPSFLFRSVYVPTADFNFIPFAGVSSLLKQFPCSIVTTSSAFPFLKNRRYTCWLHLFISCDWSVDCCLC